MLQLVYRVAKSAFAPWILILTIFTSVVFVIADPLSLLSQHVNISITATGEKNALAKSSEVWIENFGNGYSTVTPTSGWAFKDHQLVSYQNQPSTLSWNGTINHNFVITFAEHQYCGTARISVNGQQQTIDLYNSSPTWKTIRPSDLIHFNNMSRQNKLELAGLSLLSFLVFLILYLLTFSILIERKVLHDSNQLGPKNTAYLSRLDHLRFLAATLVIMYHFFHDYVNTNYLTKNPFVGLINQGHTGVGLFMVLSGFIFGVIGYDKELSYWGFLYNRVIRIYPLYIFALFVAFSSDRTAFSNVDVLFFFLPFLNEVQLTSVHMFGHLWTIGVEFTFYLIFPFLNRFVSKFGLKYIVFLVFLSIYIKEYYFISSGSVRDMAYWTIFGRIDELLIGTFFAHLYMKKPRILSHPIHMILSTVMVFTTIYWFNNAGGYFQSYKEQFWVVWPCIEGLFWAYFSLSYLNCLLRTPRWIDSMLSSLGSKSFSMYVIHYLVIPLIILKIGLITIFNNQLVDVILTGIVIVVPAVCILSFCTYYLVERPFFSYRIKYVRDKV